MLLQILGFLVEQTNNAFTIVGDKNIHPMVDSSEYAWNVAVAFAVSMVMYIIGTSIFLTPRYFRAIRASNLRHMFRWTGAWLIVEATARLDYTLILLNIDRLVPILYHLLPLFRGVALGTGVITIALYMLLYRRVQDISKSIRLRIYDKENIKGE